MATLTKSESLTMARLNEHPANFGRLVGADFYDKQREMFEAVFTKPQVSVSGANGTGKDFTAAHIVLAWLSRYWGNSKVIITAPTDRQMDDVLFNEIRAVVGRWQVSDLQLGLNVYPGSAQIQGVNPQHFALGFVTRTPSKHNHAMPTGSGMTGFHSQHLLAVISEAHSVDNSVFTNVQRLNPQCTLLTGNPFTTSGEFYDSHHSKRPNYHAISISAFDTPNLAPDAPNDGWDSYPGMVTKRNVRQRLIDYGGETNPLYVAGVLGEFPENLDDTIVPLSAAMRAVGRDSEPDDGTEVLACDVARFGRDRTVAVRRSGDVARVVFRTQGRDTQYIAGWLGAYLEANEGVEYLVVDDTGVGGGVVDRLREAGTGNTRLIAFNGGASAKDKKHYANAVSEAWMRMRQWFLGEGEYEGSEADIENDPALIAQITSRDYTYQGDRVIKIQSKDTMDKSPDEGDALAMTFAPVHSKVRIWV